MPPGMASSQPVPPHSRQPAPSQSMQLTAVSSPGST